MRISTLIYGVSYLALAAFAFARHDSDFAIATIAVGAVLTFVFGIGDISSAWASPPKRSTMELVIESLANKN